MRNTAVNLHDVIEMMGPCNGGGGRCGGGEGEAEINCGFSRADVSGEYRCDDARTQLVRAVHSLGDGISAIRIFDFEQNATLASSVSGDPEINTRD